jgi:EPS-associated MarR family transcriptional regulator
MNQDHFNLLRRISHKAKSTQRDLSKNLDLSLGKINYCLKELKIKGLIKIKNFKSHPNKIQYVYVLTPKGFAMKYKLTINFMKRKINEYNLLKKELAKNNEKFKKI